MATTDQVNAQTVMIVLWTEGMLLLVVAVGLPLWFKFRRKIKRRIQHPEMKDDNALPMPVDYLKPGPRKLSDVPLGETVHINFTGVSVDLNGKTYVERDARVYEEPNFSTVTVRMEKEGCVMTLPSRKRNPPLQYTPGRRLYVVDYVPVIAFVEEEGRERLE